MTVMDPIADMLTRIRNAVMAGHSTVALPSSKLKLEIAKILKDEGFLEGFEVAEAENSVQKVLRLKIKYVGERRERRPVISGIERVSKPGRRIYTKKQDIPWVLSGIGVAILSTPKGVMTVLVPVNWAWVARSFAKFGRRQEVLSVSHWTITSGRTERRTSECTGFGRPCERAERRTQALILAADRNCDGGWPGRCQTQV